jgi:hypothetical protein
VVVVVVPTLRDLFFSKILSRVVTFLVGLDEVWRLKIPSQIRFSLRSTLQNGDSLLDQRHDGSCLHYHADLRNRRSSAASFTDDRLEFACLVRVARE